MAKTRVPALGADGWFTEDGDGPALVGNRCTACATVFFPAAVAFCRNPDCAGTDFEPARLSRTGTVWAATDARYAPPSPYVAVTDPHEPFAIAAVSLAEQQLVVLGQVVAGVDATELTVGTPMELVIDTLFEDDDHEYLVWKWQPVRSAS